LADAAVEFGIVGLRASGDVLEERLVRESIADCQP
jgi:hypothetical protein